MAKPDVAPNITAMGVLKNLYEELAAPFLPYYSTLIRITWRDGSPDTEEIVVHDENGVPPKLLERSFYTGARKVLQLQTFYEETCGSLYAPVSALGYRSFDYSWALAFKIDCDLARKKTGYTEDAMAHYISDVAADDKILKRRMALAQPSNAGRPGKTNTDDLEERYLRRMKNLTPGEHKEIAEFLKQNKKALNESNFRHDDYQPKTEKYAVSISAGPDDLDDESFLSWLIDQTDANQSRKTRKPALDEDQRPFYNSRKIYK